MEFSTVIWFQILDDPLFVVFSLKVEHDWPFLFSISLQKLIPFIVFSLYTEKAVWELHIKREELNRSSRVENIENLQSTFIFWEAPEEEKQYKSRPNN